MTLETLMSNTLIRNAVVYTGEDFERHDNTSIYIENGRIAKIGKRIRVPKETTIVDGRNYFITPGFV